MADGLFLPGAKWRPISYRAAAGKFTHKPLGYIVHVPVSNGSLFQYFDGLRSPGRKFCTAWIAKDGSSEQYTTLDMKAWAQGDGNDDYWSFEVEGFPGEPMTDAQIATLARWHKFLGVEDRVATAPGQRGVGTHQMGGSAWGGHSCPGAIRAAQLPQIFRAAPTTTEEFTVADAKDAQVLWTTPLTKKGSIAPPAENESALAILTRVARNLESLIALEKAQDSAAQIAAAVVAALPDGHASAHDIAAEIIAQLTKD